MGDWNSWTIFPDDRAKFDAQFQLLRPSNGYLTGDQLRPYFLTFGLPVPILGHIWTLADTDVDGKLDKREFAIAMFLIYKSLSHLPLPPTLPNGLKNSPQAGFISPITPRSPLLPLNTPGHTPLHTAHTNGELMSPSNTRVQNAPVRQSGVQDWVISSESRPKYRLLFNQHDRLKRGYLTGVEAREIFLKSGLSQQILAHIWTLADVDKDGNLSSDEFCVASFLIDKAIAGHALPASLPTGLLPSSIRTTNQPNAAPKAEGCSHEDGPTSNLSFEDKRRENFLQGQLELDKRKQELAEKMRQEEEIRLEKERQEREKLEKIRLEKEEQKSKEAERQAERLRELEAQKELCRRRAFEERTKAWRDAETQRITEAERQRVETLKREKTSAQTLLEQALAHRASLLESASEQEHRRRELENRLLITTNELQSHKDAITDMRIKRDTYERDIRELTEQVEAAKAELTRYQREREELHLRHSATSPTAELHKSLSESQALHRDDIERLSRQLLELEGRMTEQGHELARRRNTAGDLEERALLMQTEVDDLRKTLRNVLQTQKSSHQSSGDIASRDATGSPEPQVYDVMFNFTARHPDELSLSAGSVVNVHPKPPVSVAAGWLYGECEGQKGLFPESYARKREVGKINPFDPFGVHHSLSSSDIPPDKEHSLQSANQPIRAAGRIAHPDPSVSKSLLTDQPLFTCMAIYPFEPTVAGDLKLAVGDVVRVYNVRDEWWEGICERTKLTGLFPANYAKKIATEEAQSVGDYSVDLKSVVESSEVNWPGANSAEKLKVENTLDHAAFIPATANDTSNLFADESGFMQATTTTMDTTKPELARVIAPYTATLAGQLSLQLGQVVQVRKRSSKGWWEGELQQRGRGRLYGWFPADYVQLITPSDATTNGTPAIIVTLSGSTPSTPGEPTQAAIATSTVSSPITTSSPTPSLTIPSASTVVERMQAIFSYKAAHADELTFEEGSIITVLGRDEPEWWRGRLQSNGAEGLFPVNYVRPYCPNTPMNLTKGSESNLTISGTDMTTRKPSGVSTISSS